MQTPNATRRQARVWSLRSVFLRSSNLLACYPGCQSVPSTTCEDWFTGRAAFGVPLLCEIWSAKRS